MPPFQSESEEDSVRTDTTAESEPEEDYQVERILLEHEGRRDNEGQKEYLIKWQNYPLHRATWEPEQHIDSPSILIDWVKQKAHIQAGKAEPFNEDEYYEAIDKAETAREDREKRRAIKRQRRIEKALAKKQNDRDYQNESNSESDDENGPSVKSISQKKRRLVRGRRATTIDDDSDSGDASIADRPPKKTKRRVFQHDSDDDDHDELEGPPTLQSLTTPSRATQSLAQKSSAVQSPVRKTATTKSVPLAARDPKVHNASNVPESVSQVGSLPNTNTNASQSAGRKSAPSNTLARRQRPRVNGESPKDSTESRFQRLSTQNRIQKSGRNEPAPDPTKLIMIDPKTGRPESIKTAATPTTAAKPKEIATAYSRRSPPRERRRDPSPPSLLPLRTGTTMIDPMRQTTASMQPTGDATTRNTIRLVDPRKLGSHGNPTRKKDLACFFWSTSQCSKAEEQCEYAHHYTGFYASPPRFFKGVTDDASVIAAIERNMHQLDDQAPIMSGGSYTPTTDATAPRTADPRQRGRADSFSLKGMSPPRQNSEDPRNERSINDERSAAVGPPGTTCYYWYEKGKCNKGDSCRFAHHDTGIYAGPPGSYIGPKTNDCWYWTNTGQCPRGESCTFSHSGVGSVAEGRPTDARRRSTMSDARMPSYVQSPISYHQQDQTSNFQAMTPTARNEGPINSPLSTTTVDPTYSIQPTHKVTPSRSSISVPPQHNTAGTSTTTSSTEKTTLARIEIAFSSATDDVSFEAQLQMTESSTVAFKSMHPSATENVHLKFDRIVLATDFRQYIPNFIPESSSNWPSGSILFSSASTLAAARIAEFMKLRAAAFVLANERFTMVLYPSGADEWKFLDGPALALTQSRLLRFRVGPPLSNENNDDTTNRMNKVPIRPETAVAVGEKAGLDSTVFQPSKSNQQGVFIMVPPSHQVESDFLTKYFQGLHFKVYHSGTSGSWTYFQKKYPAKSVIIVHPLIKLWTIPRLFDYMLEGRGGIRLFSIGIQAPQAVDVPSDRLVYCCRRLFPSSSVTLITDEVFAYHPEKAAQVIRHFIKRNVKDKPSGALTSKIVVRPGFLSWFDQLVVRNIAGKNEAAARPWIDMLDAVTTFCPPEARDPVDPSTPLESSLLISETLWPEYAELWEADNSAATKLLIEWFASWTALQSSYIFRRVEVCYKPKNEDMSGPANAVVEEAKVYQHMRVMSPEKLIES